MLLTNGSKKNGPRGSGLLATRRGTILAAAGAAILAASVLYLFISNYRDSVQGEGAPARVLVANGLIQKGSTGEVLATERMFRVAEVRTDQLRPGAVADPAQLRGRAARRDVLPGQQLVVSDFASDGGGLSDKLAGHQRAMAVKVDAVHGLDGPLRPGERVDVIASFLGKTQGIGVPVVKKLLDDVLVLRVAKGKAATAEEQDAPTGGMTPGVQGGVVLRVPARAVPQLALASDNGKVWLAARPGAGARETPDELMTVQGMLFGKKAFDIEKLARGER